MKMAAAMMDCGKMGNSMVKGITLALAWSTKADGNKINSTGMASPFGKMAESTKETMLTERKRVKESILTQTVKNMPENGCRAFNMDMARFTTLMAR